MHTPLGTRQVGARVAGSSWGPMSGQLWAVLRGTMPVWTSKFGDFRRDRIRCLFDAAWLRRVTYGSREDPGRSAARG
jgi:hypothetical protein